MQFQKESPSEESQVSSAKEIQKKLFMQLCEIPEASIVFLSQTLRDLEREELEELEEREKVEVRTMINRETLPNFLKIIESDPGSFGSHLWNPEIRRQIDLAGLRAEAFATLKGNPELFQELKNDWGKTKVFDPNFFNPKG